MCIAGVVDLVERMFPPFPIPDFAPNFTGYDVDKRDNNWYEIYKSMAQPPYITVFWVRFASVSMPITQLNCGQFNTKSVTHPTRKDRVKCVSKTRCVL